MSNQGELLNPNTYVIFKRSAKEFLKDGKKKMEEELQPSVVTAQINTTKNNQSTTLYYYADGTMVSNGSLDLSTIDYSSGDFVQQFDFNTSSWGTGLYGGLATTMSTIDSSHGPPYTYQTPIGWALARDGLWIGTNEETNDLHLAKDTGTPLGTGFLNKDFRFRFERTGDNVKLTITDLSDNSVYKELTGVYPSTHTEYPNMMKEPISFGTRYMNLYFNGSTTTFSNVFIAKA